MSKPDIYGHMSTDERIAELEANLKRRDEQLKEAREERAEALLLVDAMREQVKESGELIDGWIETFDMTRGENGNWIFDPKQGKLWEAYSDLLDRHQKLARDWNKFVGEYNVTITARDLGRPLAASDAQVKDVLKRRKDGASLRAIASAMSLSLRTVRTIVDNDQGTGRTSKRTNELRRREFDRLRAAAYRARKKARDKLPKKITETRDSGAALVKAAKGLGR